MQLLTVIVPVYNVSKYLEKCVASIISQTYSNLEIILVDDGSTDGSGELCDELSKKDKRILVIHKRNGGLSSARNAGLEIAKGDFIGFVDSDDWIEPTMYEEMHALMVNENCDLVECAVNLVNDYGTKTVKETPSEVISGKTALSHHLDEFIGYSMPRPAVWSKLYRRSFWIENRFPEGQIHEDYFLTCKSLYEAKTVGLVHKGLYNHLVSNPTSIMNSKFGRKDLYKVNQYKYRVDYLLEKNEMELAQKAQVRYYCFLLTVCLKCHNHKLFDDENVYLEIFKRDKAIISELHIPMKRRFELLMIRISPSFYYFLRNRFNR